MVPISDGGGELTFRQDGQVTFEMCPELKRSGLCKNVHLGQGPFSAGREQACGQVLCKSIGPKEKGEAEPSVPSSFPNLLIQ